jgi:ABC-2 type transport system ATP-binding protein
VLDAAIRATGLTVRFGAFEALSGVDLAVGPGEVVGLLGPNGAGKSTCVETLLGYRRPDAGTARVLGHDPVAEHRQLVTRVGAMLQHGGVWPSLPAREALGLFASYYDDPEDPDALVELLDLAGCARTPWRRLSGGEQQRLSLAIALLAKPAVLFLDEPTAGVDPMGRRVIRDVVAGAKARGVAVLLCTHDLADVEAVCDAAVVIQRGHVLAAGSVAALTSGGTSFTSTPGLGVVALGGIVRAHVVETAPGTYRCDTSLDATATSALAAHLGALGAPLDSLRHGTALEDRYAELVGADARADDDAPPARSRRARGRALRRRR